MHCQATFSPVLRHFPIKEDDDMPLEGFERKLLLTNGVKL